MTTTPKALASGTMPATQTTVYTAATATKARIAAFAVTNTSASAVTFDVWLSASGGTERKVADTVSLAAHETKSVTGSIGQTVMAGGFIQLSCSTGSVVDYYISGYEIV